LHNPDIHIELLFSFVYLTWWSALRR